MGLKRTGNYRAAALYGIIAVATLAIEVVIGIHVVTQAISQIRNGTNSFAGLGIYFGVIVLLLAIATPARAYGPHYREYRALAWRAVRDVV